MDRFDTLSSFHFLCLISFSEQLIYSTYTETMVEAHVKRWNLPVNLNKKNLEIKLSHLWSSMKINYHFFLYLTLIVKRIHCLFSLFCNSPYWIIMAVIGTADIHILFFFFFEENTYYSSVLPFVDFISSSKHMPSKNNAWINNSPSIQVPKMVLSISYFNNNQLSFDNTSFTS